MIEKLSIKNYKSIKDLNLDCKKINLFIGKPNVGKSNILEAISLFQNGVGDNIRKEDFRNLFFDQDISETIRIESTFHEVEINYHSSINKFSFINNFGIGASFDFSLFKPKTFYDYLHANTFHSNVNNNTHKKIEHLLSNVKGFISKFYDKSGDLDINFTNKKFKHKFKPYLFKKGSYNTPQKEDANLTTLAHPFGENLFTVLKNNRPLLRETSELFKEYGYNLVIDFVTDQAEIQKNVDGVVYKIPFILIADTLQRMIFHTCAIRSNKNNILLFEEPENHSFPPYIKRLAYEFIEDESNQFFIATHSPYLFDTIVADAPEKDVAVYVVTFENFQTKTRLLTSEEISTITNHGIDVFFNLNLFSNES
ncbi:MAG: AAA15 family ATPase/GTPase [Aureispira sp.]|jgi:AAA15 family ATPase/GTPase